MAPVDMVRCFNVLTYFDSAFRRKAARWAARTLRAGGLFICGSDGAQTMDARYTVYRREAAGLIAREFAFSIENLRPLLTHPWFALHDGDREVLSVATLVAILRADDRFRTSYDKRTDALLAEKRLLVRGADGHLAPPPDSLPESGWIAAREEIAVQLEREGFADQAVTVLRRVGLNAWVNPVGHVAVDPAGIAPRFD